MTPAGHPAVIVLLVTWSLFAVGVILATAFSMLPGRSWVLRVCDFPRFQVLWAGVTLIAAAAAFLALAPAPPVTLIVSLGIPLAAMTALQAWWTFQLTPLITPEVARAGGSADTFRFITANVDYCNDDPEGALDQLLAHEPDILALIETDEKWGPHLERTREAYPGRVIELRPEGCGLALLTRLPVRSSRVLELVEPDRPSIWTDLELVSGHVVSVVLLHPPPPGLPERRGEGRMSSRPRDLELHVAAKAIGDEPERNWILAGDLNDVGWSRTTVHAKRVGGLLDPRVGRGHFSTYPADRPLCRFPIDHLLVSPAFRLADLRRLGNTGSDHLPLLADLHLDAAPGDRR